MCDEVPKNRLVLDKKEYYHFNGNEGSGSYVIFIYIQIYVIYIYTGVEQ